MAKSQGKTRIEKFNTLVQTLGIIIASIIASLFTVYAFYYEKVLLPKLAPINISTELSLKKGGTNIPTMATNGKKYEAIEMKITAHNPSSRIVYLYPNKFIAYGFKVIPRDLNIPKQIPDQQENICNILTKHYTLSQSSIIAIGDFILDVSLKPGEKVGRDLIFLVPKHEYDLVQVIAYIPTCAQETDNFKLRWECLDNHELDFSMYKVSENKEEKLEKIRGVGFKGYPTELDWQYAETSSMISLW